MERVEHSYILLSDLHMQICLLERHTVDFAFRHPIYQASKNGVQCTLRFVGYHSEMISFLASWTKVAKLKSKPEAWFNRIRP